MTPSPFTEEGFWDRQSAADELAGVLEPYAREPHLLVVGIPRGGVPVAARVAERLGCPLDVLVVHRLAVPGSEDLSMGVVTATGEPLMDSEVVVAQHLDQRTVEQVTATERQEAAQRERRFRESRPPLTVRGKTAILIDDGIDTGATMEAGLRALRSQRPRELVMAAPVGLADSCLVLQQLGSRVVCLSWAYDLKAVDAWYDRCGRVSDEEVCSVLRHAAARGAVSGLGEEPAPR